MGIGITIDWIGLNPMKALFWSAVLNGIAAAPIMVAMMIVASSRKIMGRFVEHWPSMVLGWATTAVMAVASIATLASLAR